MGTSHPYPILWGCVDTHRLSVVHAQLLSTDFGSSNPALILIGT